MSRFKSNRDNKKNAEQNFVSRWSSLKHQAKQDVKNPAITIDKNNIEQLEADKEAAVKILTDDDMPDLKTMTADSDYTGFMSPGVSEKLRKLALRKLFHSEGFNIRDGLDEYDGDYTQFETLGNIITSDMRHEIELDAKRKAEQMLENNEPLDEPLDEKVNRVDPEHNEIENKSVDENIVVEAKDTPPFLELDEVEDRLVVETIAKSPDITDKPSVSTEESDKASTSNRISNKSVNKNSDIP